MSLELEKRTRKPDQAGTSLSQALSFLCYTCSRHNDVEKQIPSPMKKSFRVSGLVMRQHPWALSAEHLETFLLEKPTGKQVRKPKEGVSLSSVCCTPSFGCFPWAASSDGLPSLLRLLRPPLWHTRQLVLLSECQRERLMGYCLCVFLRWKWLT